MMAAIFFLFYYSVTCVEELRQADRYFQSVGLTVTLSVYLSIALYLTIGFQFGEVQDTQGLTRYFGPLGDQVGFIIALFCFRELLVGRALLAIFHGAAIFATGTRGALLTLFVGLLMVYFSGRKRQKNAPLWVKLVAVALVVFLVAVFGTMMVTRLTDVEHLGSGLTQRSLSMLLGLKVFLGNMLTGVGYSGFRFAALGYDPEALFPEFALNVITNTQNQLLQVATDAGIPGVIAFLLLMKIIYKALKSAEETAKDESRYSFGAGRIWLVALLVGNQTAVWLLQGSIISYLFWVLVAMTAVTAKLTVIGREETTI
jgi:O-antigen ligase